jgi:hypothetical protein
LACPQNFLMQKLPTILLALIVTAVLAIISSFLVALFVSRDAQLVQLVQPGEAGLNSLFADSSGVPGTAIGSPQTMIISDPKAFMEGTGSSGEKYVNDAYLKANNIYPLQVKTVNFFRDSVAWVAGVAALLMTAFRWWWMRRTPKTVQ